MFRFVRFRKYEFRKISQFLVSQEFANRFFVSHVSQGFRNGQFAAGAEHCERSLVVPGLVQPCSAQLVGLGPGRASPAV